MCKTYNTIGSLTTLKSQLDNNGIQDFKSLKDVIEFQNSYTTYRQEIISHHENLIDQEKNELIKDLDQLDKAIEIRTMELEQNLTEEIEKVKEQLKIITDSIPTNLYRSFVKHLKQRHYNRRINRKENNFDLEIQKSISDLVAIHQNKKNRYQYLISQFSDAVEQSSRSSLSEIERKKSIVDNLSSFIYGALGEQKVVKTLEKLSDEYFLINDFEISLSPAIYYRQENDYIKSIQIDHVLVAPSGIFLIETKNWSERSLENLSLRSPIQQIKRTSFVLFKLLNNEMSNHLLNLNMHHWGDKKISIRNLIVLINNKPKEEFQYVKILTLNELLGYINYFKPTFSSFETQRIADYLLRINGHTN